MVVWFVASALAGKWDGAETDVRVTRSIAADPETIHQGLDDLRKFNVLWPEDCATDFSYGPVTKGREAFGQIRYTYGPLRRRLDQSVERDEPGLVMEVHHAGKRGWVNQVTYAPVDGGTEVTLLTPLNAPPWPFKGVFFKEIRPAMIECGQRWLEALELSVNPK